jgi:hypothetical protein
MPFLCPNNDTSFEALRKQTQTLIHHTVHRLQAPGPAFISKSHNAPDMKKNISAMIE